MDDDEFDSLEELPPAPRFDDDDDDVGAGGEGAMRMGRNTAADLEELLEGFNESRLSHQSRATAAAGIDYKQLDDFLNPRQSGGKGGLGNRSTIHAFVETMEYADVDEDEEEIEVKPQNSRPSAAAQQRPSAARASHNTSGVAKPQARTSNSSAPRHVNPVPPVGTDARKGPTYPSYQGTPVADARKPRREKAMAAPASKAPDVFLVEKPDDHLESAVYFSGTVSFNDADAADRFLALLTQLVDQSAVVFHAIRNDNPGAARSLANVVRELRGLLHHFVDSAEEESAKQMCLESIQKCEESVQEALSVLDAPPKRPGDMWPMADNQHLADALKRVLSECCALMKVSEREQAQQFMVVVKTCLDTVENILNSHKRHCGIYLTHLQGYVSDHLYPLLDNRVDTTPDADLKQQYRDVRKRIKDAHPAFKAYMTGLWPASAPERAKSAAPYEVKREGAAPFVDALHALEDILKTLLNPVSDFEIRFNMPRKPLEDIAQNLIRASARHDRPAVVEAAKQLQQQLASLPPDDPHVAAMRISGRDLLQHSKRVLAKEEQPEQMRVSAAALINEAAALEEAQLMRASATPDQSVVGAVARASDRMALIAADPMRVSRAHEQHLLETETARKSAARVSSRASVVVELAKVRGTGKQRARQQLVDASDKVAKALEELATLQQAPDPDLAELQRLVDIVDDQQAQLFDALPPPSQARISEGTRSSVRKSINRGTTVVQLYEKQRGHKKPNEKLIVAAEAVSQTLEELAELENDATAADDELALLVEAANRQQRDLLTLAKDQSNFREPDSFDDFLNEF